MFTRWPARPWAAAFARPYVQVVFGARQTGKSTLIRSLLPPGSRVLDLADPGLRSRYLARPEEFIAECRALARGSTVFVDEVQSAPALLDAVQHLFDADRRALHFVLCGSSARKLRRTGANLLPGRAFLHRLAPLILAERPAAGVDSPERERLLPLDDRGAVPGAGGAGGTFPPADLVSRLAWGDLPGVVTAEIPDRPPLLQGYCVIHLEEEIRREALVKDWGAFVRFLRLAALESGHLVNYAAISRDAGVSQPTVKAHYQLLEDLFVGFSVPAFSASPRKNLLSTPKFLFFDLGVRHAAAGLRPSEDIVLANPGPLLEQWVGIELWKRLHYTSGALHHLRTRDGAEIDFILEVGRRLVPIEVKWTEHPRRTDARHLLTFLDEHPRRAPHAYLVCRCAHPMRIDDRVTALPWWSI